MLPHPTRLAGCLTFALFAGAAIAQDAPSPALVGAKALSQAFRDASAAASPSVVTLLTYGQNPADAQQAQIEPEDQPGPTPPNSDAPNSGPPNSGTLSGLGSGFLMDDAGWVMTNHHVVDAAKKVVVQLPDGTELTATDVHSDPSSDVAICRVQMEGPFVPALLGDSDTLEIGDWVLAIGSPFKLEATVSAGIISAKNRTLARIRRGRLLQTDAAINPGNSGGPLVDLDGRVVAVNTAIATRNGGYQGIGFAIPINQAKWIAGELREFGKVRRAAIGVRLAGLTRQLAEQLSVQNGTGVVVYQVIKDSAAQRAGIEEYDVIVRLGEDAVTSPKDLQEAIERTPVGSTVPVTVSRKGEVQMLEITLAPLEDPTATP